MTSKFHLVNRFMTSEILQHGIFKKIRKLKFVAIYLWRYCKVINQVWWSNFSDLTIFEFTNQDSYLYLSKSISQIFPTSRSESASLRFGVRERPKKCFILSAWPRELCGPVPRLLLFHKHECTHGMFQFVILVSIFMLQVM